MYRSYRASILAVHATHTAPFENEHNKRVNKDALSARVQGLRFLHVHGIVHRDLKSLNVLLDSAWTAKISDFGLAKVNSTVAASTGGGGYHSKVRKKTTPYNLEGGVEIWCLILFLNTRAWLVLFACDLLVAAAGSMAVYCFLSKQVGSDFWMAPEVHSNRKATKASDVFSLHVVMWEVSEPNFRRLDASTTAVPRVLVRPSGR